MAYAKLHGDYASISGAFSCEAIGSHGRRLHVHTHQRHPRPRPQFWSHSNGSGFFLRPT
ncbi:hypothetical protein B0H17DRAFT_716759 [Mycena rosella]|uniref:Uncharacterized protein n=1 Tax=Mycena rosella TaxID=1033263 RepID=A0AAD7D9I3_MYCRO|nr:hypothetical protein B0H17DRAFT_716759 [Mycena rosella]